MAPRPDLCENGNEESIVSTSEDDCAKLVRPGQLDTFTRQRNDKIRERLAELRSSSYGKTNNSIGGKTNSSVGDESPSSESEEERGRTEQRTQVKIRTKIRRTRSNTKHAIDVGDRVIVKEKYLGTCRYIGPIQEKYILPDIFIGIELDEQVTNNSGIFGSRQYFECPYGFGLMVSTDKVRKITQSHTEMEEPTRNVRRSKSVADLTRLLNTRNWFDEDQHIKISQGYNPSIHRSKSSSNLSPRHPIDDSDPREVLDHIKRYQPKIRTGSEYSYNSYGTMPYMKRLQSQTLNDQYGLPLQYPGGNHQTEPYHYSDRDLLRQSFARIVVPSSTPPPMHISHVPQYLPYATSYGSNALATASNESSLPYNQRYFDGHSDGFPEIEMQRYNSLNGNDSTKSSRRESSHDEYQKSYLESYSYSQPICETCAACPTCGPSRRGSFAPSKANTAQPRQSHTVIPDSHIYKKEYDQSMTEKVAYTLPVSKTEIKQRQRTSIPSLEITADSSMGQEYEKWKTRHGISMGRSMKKGLSKLQNATLY